MFILYSNIVKDQQDSEHNVKGFHMTISPDHFTRPFHQTISPDHFTGPFHRTISPDHFKYFLRDLSSDLSRPFIDIPPIWLIYRILFLLEHLVRFLECCIFLDLRDLTIRFCCFVAPLASIPPF